jgi:hypothetical protein
LLNSDYEINILNQDDSLHEWDHLVDESPQGSIFCRSWWLKAVCPQGFKLLTLSKGGRIIAGLPLPGTSQPRSRIIAMPLLTQTLGVLIVPSLRSTYESKLSYEMEVLEVLISSIPHYAHFSMNFHYTFNNWLPFYWAGYNQTTRYTYIIKDLTNLNDVFSNFTHMKRKNISKAEQLVKLCSDYTPEDFYTNHKLTLAKKGETIMYSYDLFKRIYNSTTANSAGKIWCAKDEIGNIHAAIFVVYDKKSAYYLINTIDPDYRYSGAATLLVKEAITYVSKYTKRFDLEGSMIRGVENSFRKFGAVQTPYFNITKDNRFILTRINGEIRSEIGRAFSKVMHKFYSIYK